MQKEVCEDDPISVQTRSNPKEEEKSPDHSPSSLDWT